MTADLQVALDRDRATVQAHIDDLLGAAQPRDLYEIAADYPSRPGKGLRSAICLASCRAFGGTTDDALEVATAIELLHNAFLVLDDVQDASERRRGLPTLHTQHGVRTAISAASALISLAMERVLAAGRVFPQLAAPILAEFVHLLRRSHEGQWAEIAWSRAERHDVTEADYLTMVQDKTCWYTTIHPLRLGAMIGSDGQADLDALVGFGFYVGALFQTCDDRANLLSDPTAYGKDLGADLAEGKRTLPIIDLLSVASPTDRQRVLAALGPGDDRHARLVGVTELLDRYGSIEHAERFADALSGLALTTFSDAFATARPGPDLDFLRGLVLLVRGS